MEQIEFKIYPDGSHHWFKDGKPHREDGPAYISNDGSKIWFIHGKIHRNNEPAIEWGHGGKEWLCHGKKHRIDGPAVIYDNGDVEYWLDNVLLSKEDFEMQQLSKSLRNTKKKNLKI